MTSTHDTFGKINEDYWIIKSFGSCLSFLYFSFSFPAQKAGHCPNLEQARSQGPLLPVPAEWEDPGKEIELRILFGSLSYSITDFYDWSNMGYELLTKLNYCNQLNIVILNKNIIFSFIFLGEVQSVSEVSFFVQLPFK